MYTQLQQRYSGCDTRETIEGSGDIDDDDKDNDLQHAIHHSLASVAGISGVSKVLTKKVEVKEDKEREEQEEQEALRLEWEERKKEWENAQEEEEKQQKEQKERNKERKEREEQSKELEQRRKERDREQEESEEKQRKKREKQKEGEELWRQLREEDNANPLLPHINRSLQITNSPRYVDHVPQRRFGRNAQIKRGEKHSSYNDRDENTSDELSLSSKDIDDSSSSSSSFTDDESENDKNNEKGQGNGRVNLDQSSLIGSEVSGLISEVEVVAAPTAEGNGEQEGSPTATISLVLGIDPEPTTTPMSPPTAYTTDLLSSSNDIDAPHGAASASASLKQGVGIGDGGCTQSMSSMAVIFIPPSINLISSTGSMHTPSARSMLFPPSKLGVGGHMSSKNNKELQKLLGEQREASDKVKKGNERGTDDVNAMRESSNNALRCTKELGNKALAVREKLKETQKKTAEFNEDENVQMSNYNAKKSLVEELNRKKADIEKCLPTMKAKLARYQFVLNATANTASTADVPDETTTELAGQSVDITIKKTTTELAGQIVSKKNDLDEINKEIAKNTSEMKECMANVEKTRESKLKLSNDEEQQKKESDTLCNDFKLYYADYKQKLEMVESARNRGHKTPQEKDDEKRQLKQIEKDKHQKVLKHLSKIKVNEYCAKQKDSKKELKNKEKIEILTNKMAKNVGYRKDINVRKEELNDEQASIDRMVEKQVAILESAGEKLKKHSRDLQNIKAKKKLLEVGNAAADVALTNATTKTNDEAGIRDAKTDDEAGIRDAKTDIETCKEIFEIYANAEIKAQANMEIGKRKNQRLVSCLVKRLRLLRVLRLG
ncbi:hypothetical protein AGMMS49950_07030 [Endomicrobiia bacterium]|nr:hypothetical protein AGMMS49950_07030 [Endomicrobiia bacterium]